MDLDRSALAAGKSAEMPTMVDFGLFLKERPYYVLVTQRLAPGDISTHMFLGDIPWLDADGKVYDYLYKARERGIIIADTKFEFGIHEGQVILIDEVLTPDSSRFWEGTQYAPGKSQPNYDKQFVRDWLLDQAWNRTPPAPPLPERLESKSDLNISFLSKLVNFCNKFLNWSKFNNLSSIKKLVDAKLFEKNFSCLISSPLII